MLYLMNKSLTEIENFEVRIKLKILIVEIILKIIKCLLNILIKVIINLQYFNILFLICYILFIFLNVKII